MTLPFDPDWTLHGQLIVAIKEAMERDGLTQRELAYRIGKGEPWVSRLLNERGNMTFKTAELIVRTGLRREPVVVLRRSR